MYILLFSLYFFLSSWFHLWRSFVGIETPTFVTAAISATSSALASTKGAAYSAAGAASASAADPPHAASESTITAAIAIAKTFS